MDTVVINVEFLALKKRHSLFFSLRFPKVPFSRSVAERMFELKYFVVRNNSQDIDSERKIQLFLGAKPNIQPV